MDEKFCEVYSGLFNLGVIDDDGVRRVTNWKKLQDSECNFEAGLSLEEMDLREVVFDLVWRFLRYLRKRLWR